MRSALKAGARGYVTKNVRRVELVAAIRQVYAGTVAIGATAAQQLAAEEETGSVTSREREVLGLVRQRFLQR